MHEKPESLSGEDLIRVAKFRSSSRGVAQHAFLALRAVIMMGRDDVTHIEFWAGIGMAINKMVSDTNPDNPRQAQLAKDILVASIVALGEDLVPPEFQFVANRLTGESSPTQHQFRPE